MVQMAIQKIIVSTSPICLLCLNLMICKEILKWSALHTNVDSLGFALSLISFYFGIMAFCRNLQFLLKALIIHDGLRNYSMDLLYTYIFGPKERLCLHQRHQKTKNNWKFLQLSKKRRSNGPGEEEEDSLFRSFDLIWTGEEEEDGDPVHADVLFSVWQQRSSYPRPRSRQCWQNHYPL